MYKLDERATLAHNLHPFHPACAGVAPVWVGYPAVWCPTCRVLEHVDLIGQHLTPESAATMREIGEVLP